MKKNPICDSCNFCNLFCCVYGKMQSWYDSRKYRCESSFGMVPCGGVCMWSDNRSFRWSAFLVGKKFNVQENGNGIDIFYHASFK